MFVGAASETRSCAGAVFTSTHIASIKAIALTTDRCLATIAGDDNTLRWCLRFEDLDDEVADRLGNFLEPVRNPRRNDEHIAFADVTRLSAGDVRAQPLTWPRHLAAHHLSTGHEGRFAIEDVENICLLVVDLNLTGLVAVTAGDEQIRPGDQASAFRERRRDFLGIDMDDAGTIALRASEDAHREQRRGYQPELHSGSSHMSRSAAGGPLVARSSYYDRAMADSRASTLTSAFAP